MNGLQEAAGILLVTMAVMPLLALLLSYMDYRSTTKARRAREARMHVEAQEAQEAATLASLALHTMRTDNECRQYLDAILSGKGLSWLDASRARRALDVRLDARLKSRA